MATIAERPMFSLGDSQVSPPLQSRTPVEIIDVDLLDASVNEPGLHRPAPRPRPVPTRPSQPMRRPRIPVETILLLDDSDDDAPIAGSSAPVARRRLFSPSPPRQSISSMAVPPVPNVPRRFSAFTAMPHRPHRASYASPPIVRPIDRAFSFENNGTSQSPAAGPSNHNRGFPNGGVNGAPQAAPTSHHVPAMGLGGALITNNRARIAQANESRGMLARIERAVAGASLRRIYPGMRHPHGHIEDDIPFLFANEIGHDLLPEEFLYNLQALQEEEGPFIRFQNRFRAPLAEKEHYKIAYTHPPAPDAGFTFDFAPPSSPTNAKSSFPPSSMSDPIIIDDDSDTKTDVGKLNSLLVCARCLDPLVLNSGLTQPDTTLRRVWALRCGHIVDGKCLTEIGQPVSVQDRKGKGKAKEEDANYVPYGEQVNSNTAPTLDAIPVSPESNSIRSRLRSQHAAPPTSSSATSQTAASNLKPPPAASTKKRKRGGTKSSPGKKRKVEEEYEWACPVALCGKIHVSVKINGMWGPEKERQLRGYAGLVDVDKGPRGAIGIFA